MRLSPRKSDAALVYLADFPVETARAGEELFARRKAVLRGQPVSGTFLYHVPSSPSEGVVEVRLFCERGRWFGYCSCAAKINCKHCYAAMRDLLGSHYTSVSATKGSTAKTPPGSKNPEPERTPPPPPEAASFVQSIIEKLGRELSRDEQSKAVAVVEIWRRYATSTHISESVLMPFLARAITWGHGMHQLWDQPPKRVWEAWLYLAAFLQRQKQPLPGFLAQITPQEEIDALIAAWRRRLEAGKWRDRLRTFVRSCGGGRKVELRAVLDAKALLLEWREMGDEESRPFTVMKSSSYGELDRGLISREIALDALSRAIWDAFRSNETNARWEPRQPYILACGTLSRLIENPLLADRVLTASRVPFQRPSEPLAWKIVESAQDGAGDDYEFRLVLPDGTPPPPAIVTVEGPPNYYITADTIFKAPAISVFEGRPVQRVPAEVIETEIGTNLLELLQVPLPSRLAARVDYVFARVTVECTLQEDHCGRETLRVKARADLPENGATFGPSGWMRQESWRERSGSGEESDRIVVVRKEALRRAVSHLGALRLNWNSGIESWERATGKNFAPEFVEWLARAPAGVDIHLDPILATLRANPVAATVRIEATEAGVDWFDLKVVLDVADTELTQEELDVLLQANGKLIRLGAKGWQRLEFKVSPEEEQALAEAGLDARDLSGESHRLHALQLAGPSTERLLPPKQAAAVRRRVGEIQTRVTPPIPGNLEADLRPYQIEGYHFLAYLSANRFGGILADDMGLGKTVQTLAWLGWLRGATEKEILPALVVCPKSVMLNWQLEAKRFFPSLRVAVLAKGACDATALEQARADAGLVVINYTQLRLLETDLLAVDWLAAVLDEAQFIKNPDSQTARVAVQLRAPHRLALTGTPIENRLLDLWSIMNFAMPGALGSRARFQRSFDQRKDPFARARLAARVRPFLLRRTKGQVATDLPERVEEDLFSELEGSQARRYRAELKRARQILLKIKSAKDLDRSRFNILTSLLRLRQICCHPVLVDDTATGEESAKLAALLDLLEPLMDEGHKVLVFSQFTGMLDLIQQAVRAQKWRSFLLTGDTEDRQTLVDEFQSVNGAAVFLISLRAGGFGLNLTAASYVVLFDPWWNPAVENQAIDRTHRIGQKNRVNAYRLVAKGTIEEKIRQLQGQKRALAADILGEESFTRALSLDDFKFLLGGDEE